MPRLSTTCVAFLSPFWQNVQFRTRTILSISKSIISQSSCHSMGFFKRMIKKHVNTRRHIPEESNFQTGYPNWSLLFLARTIQTNPHPHQLFLCSKSSDIFPSSSRWKRLCRNFFPMRATYPNLFISLNLINPAMCCEKYKPRSFHYTAGSKLMSRAPFQSSISRQPVLGNKTWRCRQTFRNTL